MSAHANAARTGLLAALAAAAAALPLPSGAQVQRPYSLTLYDQPDYRGGSVTYYGDNANIGSTGFATRARSAQVRGTWRLCEGGGYRNRCEVMNFNIRDLAAYGLAGRVGSAQLVGGPARPATPLYEPTYTQPYPRPVPYTAPVRSYSYTSRTYTGPTATYSPPATYAYEVPDYTPPAVDVPAEVYAPAYSTAPVYSAPDPYPAAATFDRTEGGTAVFFAEPRVRGAEVSAWAPRSADDFCRAQGLGAALYFDQGRRAPRSVDVGGRAVGEGPVLKDVLCRRS